MKKIICFMFILISILILTSCNSDMSEDQETTNLVIETTTEDFVDQKPSANMCDNIPDKGEYKIAWCDEFNYRGLPDATKWNYDVGGNGWGNNELQYYKRADRDNVIVKDDNLIITAKKEQFGGRNYTSTRLITAGKAEFKYGYIEFRAKLTDVVGTWPALWMLGNFGKFGWPECGEIDVMEHVANNLNTVHGSIHTTDYNHKDGTQKTAQLILDDVVNNYHTYAVEWTPKQIRFFIDDINYFNFNNDEENNPNNLHSSWPFDDKMFIIMNLAIGGWGGNPDPNFDEAKIFIDYVRVYQKEFSDINSDDEAPSDVQNLQTVSTSNSNIIVSWDASWDNLGVKHYEIYAKEKYNTDNKILLGYSELPRYTIAGLKQKTEYEIIVNAVDFSGNRSNEASIEIETQYYPTLPTKIEAEDYTNMYGIELEETKDIGGGQNVGWMDKGDYLVYYINVPESDYYYINYRVSVNQGGAEYELYLNDDLNPIIKTTLNYTGGWQNWNTVSSESFYLEEGTHKIKIMVSAPGSNLNWFEIN